MNVKWKNTEQGAVLVVALIMLAMVTFLVVAFVGFARFERASVTASLKRTEVSFIQGNSQSVSWTSIINSISNDDNATPIIRVSQRSDTKEFVPVYVDTTGNGEQDFNSTYLNLNSEVNNPPGKDRFFQPSDLSKLEIGDPEWIGILDDPTKNPNELLDPDNPNGPRNSFIARVAYMTVPVSEILNVRYNHRADSAASWDHNRSQGQTPRSIDLAAPLFQMHPNLFGSRIDKWNPYRFTWSMYELGAAVGDAYNYGRPSLDFKDVLNNNRAAPNSRARAAAESLLTFNDLEFKSGEYSLNTWLRTHWNGQKPYGYYKFMGTFSSAELPEEKGGFDISSIRDESTYGYGYPVKSSYDGKSAISFLHPHGLKDGDKIVPDIRPPHIVDPIYFDLINPNIHSLDQIKERLIGLIQGDSFETRAPHRLNSMEDPVKMVITDLPDNWRILVRVNTGAPWVPISSRAQFGNDSLYIRYLPAAGGSPFHWATHPSVFLDSPLAPARHQFSFKNGGESAINVNFKKLAIENVEYCWGFYDSATGSWVRQLTVPNDPMEDLPAALANVKCQLVYRPVAMLADIIPYYVKVWDSTMVSLHRSARLDEQSRVHFIGKDEAIPLIAPGIRGGLASSPLGSQDRFEYDSSTGEFTLLNTVFNRWLPGDHVRFRSSAQFATGTGGSMGGQVHFDHVFKMEKMEMVDPLDPSEPTRWKLRHTESPYVNVPVMLNNSGTHTLELVHKFKVDGLTDAVEQMAAAMLNESVDTVGDGVGAVHQLGDAALPVPNPASPFPLIYGIGAHHPSKGLWHKTGSGIPWGRGSASTFPGKGSYTPETERILQVAANIGDIYSGAPETELTGKDVIRQYGGGGYWAFGEPSADGRVSAEIRCRLDTYGQQLTNGPAGIDYGPYRVFFEPLGAPEQNIETINSTGYVKGVIVLEKSSGTGAGFEKQRVAQSAPHKLKLLGAYPDNGGSWRWNIEELVWKNGFSPGRSEKYWVGLNLSIEMESGRFVKVYLDNKEVINYSSPLRVGPELGQAVWITQNSGKLRQAALWTHQYQVPGYFFTLVHPPVPIPSTGLPTGWSVDSYTANGADRYPTAYEGVFDRDEINNVYLTGLQRQIKFAGDLPNTSWYRRGAPKILGVKDRGPENPVASYNNRMPALNEVSMRLTYDRVNNKVRGRLAMEVNMPPAGLLPTCQLVIQNLIVSGSGVAEYKDSNGINSEEGAPFPVVFNGAVAAINLNAGSGNIAAVLDNKQLAEIARVIDGATPGSKKSLSDIRFSNIQVSFKAQIWAGGRVVDFFDGTLALPSASLANPMTNHELFAPVWDATNAGGYAAGKVVLDPDNYNYYRLKSGGSGVVTPGQSENWPDHWVYLKGRKYRKIDLSSQVNDPLVNSSERGWQTKVYAPSYIYGGSLDEDPVNNMNETKVLWSPYPDPAIPLRQMYSASSFQANASTTTPPFYRLARHYFGVNLCRLNDAYQPWGRTNTGGKNDPNIKDPGVYPVYSPINGWKFPDTMRGGVQNVGWLGQVHRGTPWQTLYLKSKADPGSIAIQRINDDTGVITTAEDHNLNVGDVVGLSGEKPESWTSVPSLTSEVWPVKEVLGPNQYTVWNASLGDYAIQGYNQEGAGFYLTPGLLLDSRSWTDWAGSSDTKPVNDRRLLEAFYLSGGNKLRGRLSVNNSTPEAWSGVLHGVSFPYVPAEAGNLYSPKRILGAYRDPVTHPNWSFRFIDTSEIAQGSTWNSKLLIGVEDERKKGRFKRATDILAAPQLTDESPYLPPIVGAGTLGQYYALIPRVDELDIERIPMQILSLLKAGGPKRYQAYVFTQQLKPARRFHPPGTEGRPGMREDGTIDNYEVIGQSAEHVLIDLIGADEWHESYKRGHYGKYRAADGSLKDLPSPYPRVISRYAIDMGY